MPKVRWGWFAVVILVLLGINVAISNRDREEASGGESLEEAMCADLRDGMSMFQMHAQAVEFYRDGRSEDAAQSAAAHLEDDATRRYCPEFRDEFEATFAYEDWIAP